VFTAPGPDSDLPGSPPVSTPTAADQPAAGRPAAGLPGDPPRDPWDDDDGRPRRKRKSGGATAWVWVTILSVLGCGGLGCGGLLAVGLWMIFPEFKPFDDPGGKFHAEFPGNVSQYSQAQPNGPVKHHVEGRRGFPPETYFVHYTDLPGNGPVADPDTVLKEAADKAVADVAGGTEVSRSPVTVNGRQALQVVIDHPDDAVTVARFLLDGRRVYAVGVTGLSLADEEDPRVQGFFDRFKLTGR
jgi:hypothetical protein